MKQTISVLVENRAGVLNRITSLFSRRAFNIDSLALGVTTRPSPGLRLLWTMTTQW